MERTLELLAQYHWIYDFKLTRFFVDRVWENVPTEWIDVLPHLTLEELNNLPFGEVKDLWPDSLKSFVAQCLEASIPREQTLDSLNLTATENPSRVVPLDGSAINPEIQKGMSGKKLHEVCHMTALIDHVTKISGNDLVVDVGSGLGYLGQVLHSHFGHDVLGLEGKQCHTSGAEKRSIQTERCPGLQNVTCELHQTKESKEQFQSLLLNWFQNRPQGGSTCCCSNLQTGSSNSANKSHNKNRKLRTQSKCWTSFSNSRDRNCDESRKSKTQSKSLTGSRTPENLKIEKSAVYQKQSICENEFKGADISEENVCTLETSSVNSHGCDTFKSVHRVMSDIQTGSQNVDSILSENHVVNETDILQDVYLCSCCIDISTSEESFGDVRTERTGESLTQCKKILSAYSKHRHVKSPCTESTDTDMQRVPGNNSERIDNKTGIDSSSNDDLEVLYENKNVAQLNLGDAKEICSYDREEIRIDKDGSGLNMGHIKEKDSDDIVKGCSKGLESCDRSLNKTKEEGLSSRLRSCEGYSKGMESCDGIVTKTKEEALPSRPGSFEGSVCMVGLHCCGDLTPTMLHYFVEIDRVRALCCVSCCYHRMKYNDERHQFDNFPMSTCVQEALAKISSRYPTWSLNAYAMRLAAQETRGRWKNQSQEDHDYHCKNVAYRALLELCMDQGGYTLKKTARKLAHKNNLVSFEAYVDIVSKQVDLPKDDDGSLSQFKQQMMAVYQSHLEYIKFIEPFTALQYLLQPILETLIIKDRQLWLQQHGYHSNIVPVFDEVLSPRNLAIVAVKC